MNYKKLEIELNEKLKDTDWECVHAKGSRDGGVYLWRTKISPIMETNRRKDSRLNCYSLLFEFHITAKNYARVMARARFHGTRAENDKQWATWKRKATAHCNATPPRNAASKTSKSVARWDKDDFKDFVGIRYTTPEADAAIIIANFFRKPPQTLQRFVAQLLLKEPSNRSGDVFI